MENSNIGEGILWLILTAIGILSIPLVIAYVASVASTKSLASFGLPIIKIIVAVVAIWVVLETC